MMNATKLFLATCIALLPLSLSAQNAHVSGSPHTPYLGDSTMTIEAPAGGNLRSFQIATHKGKYRMGLRVNLAARGLLNQMVDAKERSARRAGVHVQRTGDKLLMDLLMLGENQDIISVEAMGSLYENAKRPYQVNAFMRAWAPAIERAARGALADDAYREVFCVEEVDCPLDKLYGVRPYDITGMMPIWGAGYNEFRFRAAYQVFLDKYLLELVEWAASIRREVAVVGTVRMPRYDFTAGAYVFNVNLSVRMKALTGGMKNVSKPNVDLTYYESSGGELELKQIAWKLPRAEAEAFRETMTERKLNALYTLIDGELVFDEVDRVAMGNEKLWKKNTHVELTGKTITLYFDPELTEEVVTFSLQ